jgi:SOS-response transcriptional repressor LexA
MGARKEPGAEEFGRRLKARREELGLSRRDVVEASGLSYPYVSQLETGYRLPSHKALAALAEALELPPSELSAAIPYQEALALSDLGAPRQSLAGRRGGWHGNPKFVAAAGAPAPPPPDPNLVAQQVADLVGRLPHGQRLDALSLAQREVMERLVTERTSGGKEKRTQ